MKTLTTTEIDAPEKATHSIICLHGLGASGSNLASLAPYFKLQHTRFVCPDAPEMPVTINGGYVMRAWHDIKDLNQYEPDKKHIADSAQAIKALIANEQASHGIAPENIVLLGFSQGGAMALHVGLNYPDKIAGVVALSCYPVLGPETFNELCEENKTTPVFIAHGVNDDVVTMDKGRYLSRELNARNYSVEFQSYDMAHEINLQEIQAIGQWLSRVGFD